MKKHDEQEPLLGNGHIPSEEESTDSPTKEDEKPGVNTVTLVVLVLGAFWALACESFVISTHDDIASFFDRLSMGPWLLTAYNMGYCIMLPLYGNLADMYGTKRMLLLSYAIFGLGTIVTGCALSMPMAIFGRFTTSIGGAGMIDLASILITELAPIDQVPVLRSYIALGIGLGLSCGSPLGGVLTDTIGWRWSFLCQAPAAFLCVLTAARQIPSDNLSQAKSHLPDGHGNRWRQLDFVGFSFLVIFIGCLLFVLQAAGESTKQDQAWVSFLTALCIASGVAFVLVELRTKKVPLIPFSLINNGVGKIWLGQALLDFANLGLLTNLSSYLIYTRNANNSAAGMPMVIFAVGAIAGSLISGRLIQRFKRCNALSAIGVCLTCVCYVLILIRWRWKPHRWEIGYILLQGLGTQAIYASQFMAMSVRATGKSASVITTYYLCQQIGAILGSAGFNALFRTLFQNRLMKNLADTSNAREIIQKVLRNNRYAFSLPESVQTNIQLSFLESYQIIPILSLCSGALLLLIILTLKDIPISGD